MRKKGLPFAIAVLAMLVLAGCGGVDAVITTDLTTFDVVSVDYYTEYDAMTAGEGSRIMVIAMTAQTEFDEKKFKSYFCADDGSSVARIYVDETETYDCSVVAYQGSAKEETVEYALIFEVPDTVQKAKLITLEAPNQPQVAIKGKLPE